MEQPKEQEVAKNKLDKLKEDDAKARKWEKWSVYIIVLLVAFGCYEFFFGNSSSLSNQEMFKRTNNTLEDLSSSINRLSRSVDDLNQSIDKLNDILKPKEQPPKPPTYGGMNTWPKTYPYP